MDTKTADIINKVIAVLGYIGAGFMALLGIIFLFAGNAMAPYVAQFYPEIATGIFATVAIIIGAVLLGFAVLEFFISKGLWEHKNWARITTLVFSCIGAAIALPTISIISLAINGFMIYFYGFDKGAKELFK